MVQIKEYISEFLENEDGLILSPDKTCITNAKKDMVKFLGFSLSYFATSTKITTVSKFSKVKERFHKSRFFLASNKLNSLEEENNREQVSCRFRTG